MKYTVVYKPLAEFQLADIWLRCADKQAVTESSDAIERLCARTRTRPASLMNEGGESSLSRRWSSPLM